MERMQMSLSVLQKLADHEASMPGRKLVVWISPGWPFLISGMDQVLESQKQKQWFFDSIVALSDGFRRARITLYNIDPLGTADALSLRATDYKQFLKPVKKADQADIGDLALQVLASQSGGRVLNSSNDLAGEIATCAADANSYYVLSFEGLPGDGPNEYHALEIKIDKPGLTVRTRSGYYAQPER
jgi:VWFA-related protein